MQKVTDHSTQRNVKVKKTQDHLNACAVDGTTTTVTFHFVCARFTEPLVATWHKRDTRIAVCDEADFA